MCHSPGNMNRPWYLDDLLASYECVSDNDVRICDFGDDSRQLKLRIRESWKSPRANSDSGAQSAINQRSPSHSILKLRTSSPGIYCKMPRNGRVTTLLFLPIYIYDPRDGRRWIIRLEALDIGSITEPRRGPNTQLLSIHGCVLNGIIPISYGTC